MGLRRQLPAALRLILIATLALGLAYPLAVTAVGLALPDQADGSLVRLDGAEVGSALLGQATDAPEWFQPRPSASDYSGDTSGGTNLAASSAQQRRDVAARAEALCAANPDAVGPIPADALTASGSGLDPDISPEYASWQAPRVAAARRLPLEAVQRLVAEHTRHALLGFIGADRVNVTELNLALATLPADEN